MSDQSQAACSHMRCIIRGTDKLGEAYCPDCEKNIPASEAFNNYIKQMQDCIDEFKKLDVSSISLRLRALEERVKELEAAKHTHG